MNNDIVEYLKMEKKLVHGGPLFEILVKDFGTILYVEIDPGQSKAPHYHKEITEYFFVIAGRGKCHIDGVSYELSEGVRLKIPPNILHIISNDGEEKLQLLAFKNKPFSEDSPDKYKHCPKCGSDIVEKETGRWICVKCNKIYSKG